MSDSRHAQTERVFHCHGPCQLAVLATSSDHLPCLIMIITDKHIAGSSKTGSGVEAEGTQDLAGPAKAAS